MYGCKHPTRGRLLQCLTAVVTILVVQGCSSGSDSPDNDKNPGPTLVSLPLEEALSEVQLPANQTTFVTLTLQVPPEIGTVDSAVIDIKRTMQHVTVTTPEGVSKLDQLFMLIAGDATAQAIVRVGDDPTTVCELGIQYGPFSITTASLSDPDPDDISLDPATVQILNAGSMYLCIEIFSPVPATFSIDRVEANVTEGDCDSPANFAGVWSGTYECGNSCGQPFGGDVQITVTQVGSTASYTDLVDDHYTGTVCGNRFRFERVEPQEIERGTLTLLDADHAEKHSTWRMTSAPYCHGDCTDTLTRVSGL